MRMESLQRKDLQMKQLSLVAALCAFLSVAASENIMVPEAPVSARLGHTVTLPCWLNPPQNAEGLEVRWYRGNQFDAPVLFYRERRLEDGSQHVGYAGRVSFGLQSTKSGGLRAGDVTLELANVTLEDAGEYTCYVSSDQGYDKASVDLNVTGLGTSPLLSVVWREDALVNVSCESDGWHPKPRLRWSDRKETLTPRSLVYNIEADGLVSVRSWLLVSTSSTVSCSIGVSEEEYREGHVRLESLVLPESGSAKAGWVAFVVMTVIAAVAALGAALYFIKRGHISNLDPEKISDHGVGEENETLLPTDKAPKTSILKDAIAHHVNVTLESTSNQYLSTRDGKVLRDAPVEFPDGEMVTHLTSIRGTPGFSSGQHYWEVNLGNDSIGLKKSWWVGVANATVKLEEWQVAPTPSNGFWLLSSDKDRFQVNTEPVALLPVDSRPQTLGVYLKYDEGELTFYNVEEERHIVTLAIRFTGEVFPFFNPGKGDTAPITISRKPDSHMNSGQCPENQV